MGAQEQVGRSVGIAVAAPLGVGDLSSADPARWEQVCREDCRASLDDRGWPLPRGRTTFGDELDAGVRGGKTPRLQPLLSWAMPLSAPGRTPQGSISCVARCVSHHRQARMGRWGSRPVVGRAV